MIVSRNALGARNALIFHSRLENRSCLHLAYGGALHLLPWRLAVGIDIAACCLEGLEPRLHLSLGNERVDLTLSQIDTHAVSGLENSEATADSGFGRSVQDRR